MCETCSLLQYVVTPISKILLELLNTGYVLVASCPVFICLLQIMIGRALIAHLENSYFGRFCFHLVLIVSK